MSRQNQDLGIPLAITVWFGDNDIVSKSRTLRHGLERFRIAPPGRLPLHGGRRRSAHAGSGSARGQLLLGIRCWRPGDYSGGTGNRRVAFTFTSHGGGRECSRNGLLALSGRARPAAAVLVLLLRYPAPNGVILLKGCGPLVAVRVVGGVGAGRRLQSLLHLADAGLKSLELGCLRIDLLFPALRYNASAHWTAVVGLCAIGSLAAGGQPKLVASARASWRGFAGHLQAN